MARPRKSNVEEAQLLVEDSDTESTELAETPVAESLPAAAPVEAEEVVLVEDKREVQPVKRKHVVH